MRLNKKKTVVAAVLALSILTGCGASGTAASSVASSAAASEPASSVAASSEAASAENTEANGVQPIEVDGNVDELVTGNSSYKVYAGITNVSDDSVTLEVYGYDAYEPDDIAGLQAGDVIYAHDEQTSELEAVTIESIEQDEYGGYTINGGIEEGGIDLTQDRGVFRTITFDGYPVYYKLGDVTLPLAEDVVLEDSSADPNASMVETTGAADVARDIADSDNWTVYNTTVFVQDGHVTDIQRVWVP